MNNIFWMGLVVFCSVLGATGQLLFKISVSPINIIKLGAGFMCYGLAMVLYLASLRHLELSVAYPLIALSYIGVAVGSYLWLGESWSLSKSIGSMGLILCVWLIAR